MWKQIASSYFSFTKKERSGIFILLSLILFFILLPFGYPLFIKTKVQDTAAFEKEIASLKIQQQDSSGYTGKAPGEDHYAPYAAPNEKKYNSYKNKGELFYFDPNTASGSDWQRLGIKDKTVITIQKYLSKGGHFYKAEDIRKIWGLHPDEAQRLLPYIQIAAKEDRSPQKNYETKNYDKAKSSVPVVDINTADTSNFIALPGIGSKLAQRIINFRDKLGGFYKTEQVAETFGLPDSTFQKIKARLSINKATIKQLNINTATLDEMRSHPYIRYAIANAIVQYRTQHGNFAAVTDIKKIMLVTEELFIKLEPYLTVQ
jgi:competence protein ComEA